VSVLKLAKNPEVVKLLLVLTVLLSLSLMLALSFTFISSHHLEETMLTSQAALIGAVIETYPNAEPGLIRQVKGADEETIRKGEALLARYGLQGENLLSTSEAVRAAFQLNGMLYVALAVSVFLALVGLFFLFLRRHYRKIRAISDYLSGIAAGNYALAIRDNDEGELSILRNEIYKITVMLKEQAETLKQDKIRLADSLADISHQLKTPLTSLIVLSDLLEDDPAEEVKEEFLARMRSQLKRMEWLTTSLLKLSRLEAGTVTMKKDAFKIRELIDRAVQALSIPLEIKGHQVEIAGDEGAMMTGDLNWTLEALINILKNHIEHTPEKGLIRIAYEDNPIFTKITTADNGEGIDREDLPYVFNRFYRGKNASEESAGIGLAMAYEIVKQQGGDITVKSEPQEGTQLTITLYKQRI
jgi:signal transduction histidine kinase